MRVAYRVSYQVLNWENCCPWTAFVDVWIYCAWLYICETQTANYWQLLHIVKHESYDIKLPCCWHHRDNWCREGGGGQTRGCSVSDPTIHLPLHESSTRSSSSLSPSFRMSTFERLASSPCTARPALCAARWAWNSASRGSICDTMHTVVIRNGTITIRKCNGCIINETF